jgi:long-chain fatty acid transport protein
MTFFEKIVVGKNKLKIKFLLHRSSIVALALLPTLSIASGYKLNEQSAAGMGTAHAGRAAMAEDASVVFYNPAGMTEFDRPQFTAGLTYISGVGEFNGNSFNAAGSDITGASDTDAYSNGGNYLGDSVIPYFYYVQPVNENLSLGLGVFIPFATKTNYDDDFVGGSYADETSLATYEIQPSIAYKINDKLSIGGGIDIVYMEGLLSKFADLVPYNAQASEGYDATYAGNIAGGATEAQATAAAETAVGGLTADSPILNSNNAGFESHSEVGGSDWGYGFNIGVYYTLSDTTTLGFAYRSEVEFDLKGEAKIDSDNGIISFYNKDSGTVVSMPTRDQAAEVTMITPQSATFSVTHQISDSVLLQAGTTWTGWSSFQAFDAIATENIANPADTSGGFADGYADPSDLAGYGEGYVSHIDENWNDVWAIAIGSTYQLNNKFALRAGYAYDQSPVDDAYRTARVPSSDRQWLTAGMQYAVNNDLSIDIAAGYLYMKKMSLSEINKNIDNSNKDAEGIRLAGDYEIDVWSLSAQMNYQF